MGEVKYNDYDSKVDNFWWDELKKILNIDANNNDSNSLMALRKEALGNVKIDKDILYKAAQDADMTTIHSLLQNYFLEPIKKDYINRFVQAVRNGLDLDGFVKFRDRHIGMRFLSVLKAVER